jgi:thioredoxin 1
MGLQAVTDGDFEQEVLGASLPVVVDFWADWCNPCRMIAPIVEQLADEQKDEIKVTKLDVDSNPRTASTYGVQSIPTLILFRDGKEVKRFVGVMPKEKLAGDIQRALSQVVSA